MKMVLVVIIWSLGASAAMAQMGSCRDITASITAGPGDIAVDCDATYTGSVSGGDGPYDYEWSGSTGWASASASGQTVSMHAQVIGTGTMTLLVTDEYSGETGTATQSYTVHNATESTGKVGDGSGYSHIAIPSDTQVTSYQENDSDSNEVLTYITNHSTSTTFGFTATIGGELFDALQAQVQGKAESSHSNTTGEAHNINVAPGQTAAIGVKFNEIETDGTWTTYDCTGKTGNGTWTDLDPVPAGDFRCEIYYSIPLN